MNPGAAGNNHPFAECPLLKKLKNLGSSVSSSRTVRTVTTSDDDSDEEEKKVSAVSVKGKGKAFRFNVPR